jgi:thioredoxin 1
LIKNKALIKVITAVLVLSIFLTVSQPVLSQPDVYDRIPALGIPTVLDLGATACIPCKMMAPILEKLHIEYQDKAAVIFVDVWKDATEAKRFGIRTIPTQIFFNRDGVEVFRHEGFFDEASIVKILDDLIGSPIVN